MSDVEQRLDELRDISVWKRGSRRAPHKPLLLLMTLASVQRGEARLQPYARVRDRLRDLLVAFGPPRKRFHPEYPFWRLQNDGSFWEIPQRGAALEARKARSRSGDIPSSVLTAVEAEAGFTPELHARLRDDPTLVNILTAEILEEHFPPSMHQELLDAVGMPWVVPNPPVARCPDFRAEVLRLYEHRCAMCGFDGQLGGADLALEAAHVMWHALGGPDDPTNGLLLCSLHHKALDRGALGLTDDHRVVVSQHVRGGSEVSRLILGLGGRPVSQPIDPGAAVAGSFIAWHRREVFRDPARPAA